MEAITISKRGTLTLPPQLRRQLGLDKLPNPVLLVEEREGGIFLRASTAVPVRDLPRETVEAWIADDEAELTKLGLDDIRRR